MINDKVHAERNLCVRVTKKYYDVESHPWNLVERSCMKAIPL